MKAMKETDKSNQKGKASYVPPRSEVIGTEPFGVLCSSALTGNSTESVGRQYFSFP